jgi:hypothetical protein
MEMDQDCHGSGGGDANRSSDQGRHWTGTKGDSIKAARAVFDLATARTGRRRQEKRGRDDATAWARGGRAHVGCA